MTPFKDTNISLIDGESARITTPPNVDTITFDMYRQGAEVTLVNHFMRSTLPYFSSKGLRNTSLNTRIVPELDMCDLGQNVLAAPRMPFEDMSVRLTPAEILSANAVQSFDDEYNVAFSNDGKISVLTDSGKVEFIFLPRILNARGIKADTEMINNDTFKNKTRKTTLFYDCADQINTIPTPGYIFNNMTVNPFKETTSTNGFSQAIDYTYIGENEKTYSRGWSYSSSAGTDSIAFGGLLR